MPGTVLPYALSVHGFIDKVGADAGFAAIIGLALLIIVFFVASRETAELRDRAEEAEERLERMEHRIEQSNRAAAQAQAQAAQATQAAQAQPVASRSIRAPGVLVPAAAPAAAAAWSRSVSAVAAPSAPVGVGGPALSSATRLIPAVAPALPPSSSSTNGTATPAPSTAAASGVVPPPVIGSTSTPISAPSPAPASNPATPTPGPVTPPPRLTPRPSAGETTLGGGASAREAPSGRAPRRNYGRPRRRFGVASFALGAVLVVVIVVAAVLLITHHSSSSGSGSGSSNTAATSHRDQTVTSAKGKKIVTVDPRNVTVAVLNGTTTTDLAADVSGKLSQLHFQPGETGNYSDQSEATTTVGFMPNYRPEGLAVAKALGLTTSAAQPVNSTARQIVCAATPSGCPDQVIVTVGADLASDA